jgi:hypothetical protein
MARRWVWSFWEAAVGSLSEARTAVSSAKVAVVISRIVIVVLIYHHHKPIGSINMLVL